MFRQFVFCAFQQWPVFPVDAGDSQNQAQILHPPELPSEIEMVKLDFPFSFSSKIITIDIHLITLIFQREMKI